MKRLFHLLLATLLLAGGCAEQKRIDRGATERDSLQTIVDRKDSLIEAVFADINAITENLAQIKVREHIISTVPAEGIARPIDQVNSDLAAIEQLLAENRAKIAGLQRTAAQLRQAKLRIGELERLIEGLNTQLDSRNAEISQLRAEIAEQALAMQQLNEQLTVEQTTRRAEVDSLSQCNDALDRELHTVYYIVGQRRQLIEAEIIDRSLKVAGNNSLEGFLRADSRELVEIPIRQKRVSLVTSHPEEAYRLIRSSDKTVQKLVITDPERFWESSRVLIVCYR